MDPLKKEFLDLLRLMGWTQAEAARQLCMTSGAVNQIVNPNSTVRPSPTTLRLFKLMVAAQRPERLDAHGLEGKEGPETSFTPAERRLVDRIRQVNPQDRPMLYAVIHAIITVYSTGAAADGSTRRRPK